MRPPPRPLTLPYRITDPHANQESLHGVSRRYLLRSGVAASADAPLRSISDSHLVARRAEDMSDEDSIVPSIEFDSSGVTGSVRSGLSTRGLKGNQSKALHAPRATGATQSSKRRSLPISSINELEEEISNKRMKLQASQASGENYTNKQPEVIDLT
jgi:hypothetical protein